jgi:hypothetical protein
MDKNSIIGIVLIVLIFLGYYQITKPTKEQLEAQMVRKNLERLRNVGVLYKIRDLPWFFLKG